MRRVWIAAALALPGVMVIGGIGLLAFLLSEARTPGSGTAAIPGVSGVVAAAGGSSGPSIITTGQAAGISVSGEGVATVVPDVAIIDLGVEASAPTVAEARDKGAKAMEALQTALKAKGVDSKDIKTVHFNIHPDRRYDKIQEQETTVGFKVVNLVTVKVRKVDDAGPIIDAVVNSGGNLVIVSGVRFTLDDPKKLVEGLRVQAMNEAKSKAEHLAKLSGVTLGKPIYIAEGAGGTIGLERFSMGKGGDGSLAAATPVEPGETQVRLSLQVVYAIQ
ncbi:MAG: hypothetical protein HW403_1383 [Dehalococcoidia bacterium]|nr:hypothetical protein [Dehalococcoidia bacterium]